MRKILFLLLSSLFLFACCKSDDNMPAPNPNIPEVEKLPPATQTGTNTVGCLINDMAFLPSGTRPSGNSNPYCGYYHDSFVLSFSIIKHENNTTMEGSRLISIYSNNTILEESEIYVLKEDNQNHSAIYSLYSLSNPDSFETNNEYTGELHITKLDKDNNIISG